MVPKNALLTHLMVQLVLAHDGLVPLIRLVPSLFVFHHVLQDLHNNELLIQHTGSSHCSRAPEEMMRGVTSFDLYQCLGSGSTFCGPPGSSSVSVSQRYGSEDPDPYQNVTDPQH